jgi:hypothetical protein
MVASTPAPFVPANASFCSLTICNNSTTEANFQVYFPRGGTFANLYARSATAPGTGNAITVTLKTCAPSAGTCVGAAQTLTCTISGASGAGAHNCNDATHSVSVSAGELVDWAITTTGSPASTTLNLAAEVR